MAHQADADIADARLRTHRLVPIDQIFASALAAVVLWRVLSVVPARCEPARNKQAPPPRSVLDDIHLAECGVDVFGADIEVEVADVTPDNGPYGAKPSEFGTSAGTDWADICLSALCRPRRLDHRPELLFRLRAVDETDLVAGVDAASPLSKTAPAASKVLETDDISALFGLDMGAPIAATASATAVVAEANVPNRVSVGMPPEEPALKKQARTAPKAPGKPSVPRRTATAKASSGPTVPEKTNAATETGTTRREPATTPEPAATHRRRKAGSAGIPGIPEVPGRGRRERLISEDKAAPARASKQKPVKWW